jgi:hypothetical protein
MKQYFTYKRLEFNRTAADGAADGGTSTRGPMIYVLEGNAMKASCLKNRKVPQSKSETSACETRKVRQHAAEEI